MALWVLPAIGYILALGAMGITSKIAVQRVGWQELVLWTAGVYVVVATFLIASGQIRAVHWDYGSLMALISGGLAASGLILFFIVVKEANVSRAVPFMASYPVVTVLLAILVLSERLTVAQAAGTALVVAGVVVLSSQGG
jgi:transporter family protein